MWLEDFTQCALILCFHDGVLVRFQWYSAVFTARDEGLHLWNVACVQTNKTVSPSGVSNKCPLPPPRNAVSFYSRNERIGKQLLQCFLLNGVILWVSHITLARLVSRSQTVWGGKTVWTTDVERFVLTPTGTGVGDKWVLSVCGARAARESH